MSALRQDPATMLGWVREDLEKQLGQLGSKLEHLANVPGVSGEAILEAANSLDELRLTLLMLELPGAAMLMEEMAQLCQLLGEHRVDPADKGFAALLDALVIMPAYLDRLQSGHRDLPVLLLPAINKLRSAHRASESVAFDF